MAQATAPPKGPLGVLPSMLHAVFMQTANVFNDSRKHNSRAVVSTNALIRLGVPAAIDRFQYALDCLEVEILRAKATFRRDLEILRQKAAQEAKAIAEREAEEARAKALAEEEVAQERRQFEEKEAQKNATSKVQEQLSATANTKHINADLSAESRDITMKTEQDTGSENHPASVPGNPSNMNDDDLDMLFDVSPVEVTNSQKAGQGYAKAGGPAAQATSQPSTALGSSAVPQAPSSSVDSNSLQQVGSSNTGSAANPSGQKPAPGFADTEGVAQLDDYGTFGEEFDNLYMYP